MTETKNRSKFQEACAAYEKAVVDYIKARHKARLEQQKK